MYLRLEVLETSKYAVSISNSGNGLCMKNAPMNEITGAFSLMDAGFLAEFQLTPKILFKLMILSCPSDGQNISGL